MGAHHITVVEIRAVRVGDIESVLHLPRRMIGRHIQGIEIVELVFNIGPLRHFKTHFAENGNHFFIDFGHRVKPTLNFRTDRQG